jgi:predicted NAD-dependent protein-ADP-ribosyltransferase YbiA (DUF1768 family)
MTHRREDRLCFFSGSKDAAPGEGAGESVEDPNEYATLKKMKNWRQVLSNFHESAFEFQGKIYATIEHAFQAAKIGLVDAEKAKLFSLSSGSSLSRGGGIAARKARKMVILDSTTLAHWDSISSETMARIATAKYAACREAREVLLATAHAQLWHRAPRLRPERFRHLERIRDSRSGFTWNSGP